MYRYIFIILFPLCIVSFADAQDIHFSQFYHNPLNLNPALTGVFKGDQRFGVSYRSQWQSVPVPYLTVSGSYDQKVYHKLLPNGLLGWGIVFNYDRAGDANLSWTQLGGNLAYTHRILEEHYFSVGFQFLAGQRAFDPDKLQFGDQFNGDILDLGQPSAEAFNNTSVGYGEISAGFNWLYQSKEKRHAIRAGIGFSHLNQANVAFFQQESLALPLTYNAYLLSNFEMNEILDIGLIGLWRKQLTYQEFLLGLLGTYYLKTEKDLALWAGLSYRFSDAAIFQTGIQYQNWRIGLSYDINISDFRVATNRRGGPEISLQYIITAVKPPDTFKACPIF